MSIQKKITILGAGNGGYATAFDLSQRGYEVMLYESPQFRDALAPIESSQEIVALKTVNLFEENFESALSGKAKIHATTTDIKEAAEFSNLFILIVPPFAHTIIFQSLMPYLKDGDIVFSLPGNYAALVFDQMLQEAGIKKDVTLIDAATIPYACRKIEKNTIFISAIKHSIPVATYPSNKFNDLRPEIENLFSTKIMPLENVIAVGLSNLNIIVHPLISLLNTARIQDKNEHFYFYAEGASKAVCQLMEKLDIERLEFAKHLNLNLPSFRDLYVAWYGDNATDIYEMLHDTYHAFFLAPHTLKNRYFTEDIPYLMIPILRYAKEHDIDLPITSSIVTLAEGLLSGDEALLQPNAYPNFKEVK